MSEADPPTVAATEQAKSFKEASDKVRERSDVAAKGLAALGTAGLTAVGIAKVSDIFPVPPDQGEWVAGVIGGFLAIAFVLAAFPLRLWHATRPLVTGVDPYGMDATGKEQDEIVSIYERTWKLNGVKSLSAYQARAHRFQRIADRAADPGRATSLRATAERVRAEIQATQARAALIVIRRRVNRALMGKAAKGYISLFVGGLLLFGISADKLDSERSARVAASKACADAVGAKVLPEKLPPICNGLTESKAPPANADQTRAQGIEALSTAYKSCVDTAVEQERPVGMCDGIKTQLVAAAK